MTDVQAFKVSHKLREFHCEKPIIFVPFFEDCQLVDWINPRPKRLIILTVFSLKLDFSPGIS